MKLFARRSLTGLLARLLLLSVLLAACGSGGSTTRSSNHGKGCQKIGVLLPDITASGRWESKDRQLLTAAIKNILPAAAVDYNNAEGSATEQQDQAVADLAKGDCILVVAAIDSAGASEIVRRARLEDVPVIAYDRLIQSKDLSYYVSFDNVRVGELQGQYIVDHYKEYVQGNHHNVVLINGSPTDNNAILFRRGVLNKLQPLFASGTLTKLRDFYTPNWDHAQAQSELTAALSVSHNNIQIVYVANDGMADAVIATLKAVKLNGKVLVTGQGATVTGIQHILTGEQAMTVYKPFNQEAVDTAKLVAALSQGTDPSALTHGATIQTTDGGSIPAVVETPLAVDKSNIVSTVIADGFVSRLEVCSGLPAGTDTNGLCS